LAEHLYTALEEVSVLIEYTDECSESEVI